MWLVSVSRSQVWMGSRCVKFGFIALTLTYWSLEVQHGTSWQRTLWEESAQCHTQRSCLGNRRMSAASIAIEVEGVGGQPVSAQTIRRTLHQIGLHWLSSQKEASSKYNAQESPANSLLKTSRLRTWITGTMSCGLMRPRPIYLVQMVLCMSGGNQVRSTKTNVSCLQSSMVVGMSWSGAAWELPALGSYSSLREPWMPTCTVTILKQSMIPSLWRLCRRAVFQHDNDHCLAKEAESKGGGLAKHVSRPKPYWASVGHPQTEGGGAQGL